MTGRGRFIVFEGGEGCGKSTQAARLAEDLGALLTREPGDTQIGAALRALLLDPATVITPVTEALLMAADRAEHVAAVVEPALSSGQDVVCDRYVGSSVAYQGHGRGLDVEQIRTTSAWATGGLEPDLVLLLEVPAAVAAARRLGWATTWIGSRRQATDSTIACEPDSVRKPRPTPGDGPSSTAPIRSTSSRPGWPA